MAGWCSRLAFNNGKNLLRLCSSHPAIKPPSPNEELHKRVADIVSGHIKPPTRITIQGWVKSLRKQKKHVFFDVNDGSTCEKLQVFTSSEIDLDNLSWGSSVKVTGQLSCTPKGQLELVAEDIKVVGGCDVRAGYPFNSKQIHPPEYLRQYLHLRPRTNFISSILRVRDTASKAIHDYFEDTNYVYIHSPILTSNDCEGAGEIFKVIPDDEKIIKSMKSKDGKKDEEAYFNKKTYLTVSGQLHLEAVAHSLCNVYSFGPTFRAENSKSRLHLSEFYMVEAETAFTNSIDDIKGVIEDLVKHTTEAVLNKRESDVFSLRGNISNDFNWLGKSFVHLTYDEAISLLQKNLDKFEGPLEYGDTLGKEHELLLVKLMDGVPTFVTNWPKKLKPFYMREVENDNEKVAALDLLVPITGELAGGSLRENDYLKLKQKLPSTQMEWYLELRKFGGVPTGGFGLGFERYLQFLCNIQNIKDTIPFPRWPHNCSL